MCENPVHNEFQEHNANIQPSGGLHLAIHTGYGMMTDPMDEASFQALTSICLCHDCSIKVIDMFPQEFKDNFFAGGHPVETCVTTPYSKTIFLGDLSSRFLGNMV